MQINESKTNNDGIKQEGCPNCACKLKVRDKDGKEYKDLLTRLNRIEGQVRGIKNMLEEDRYCVDILTQVSAISSALNSFNKKLLAQHIKSCVVNDIREGKDEVVDELCLTLQKLMK
ncbi:MAG: metal-sensing transcriptional repressor [Acidaminococcaceae bacterium]|nr:metal-sensing transcriptional repressor [Acidaminococcaceae bacterium]MDD4721186.1 metal-sensing transcriptional repressor [Acidaminococcaceae bacterium]